MRFMVMHKVDANMEAGGPPNQGIVQGMGKLVGEGLKSGVFLDGAGLHRSAKRVRLSFRGGACSPVRGPYQGQNELVARAVMIKTASIDGAVEIAQRFAQVLGDVEIEIGPVVEPWDLFDVPKPPEGADKRFLLLQKGDAESEAGELPSAERRAALSRLTDELTRAGVLLTTIALAPSSRGARLASEAKGKRAWVDGPFAESKELVAGFSILNVPSRGDALAWADRYAAILGDNEVDVRLLADEG